ncbi:MAG: hypothetical protein JSV92_03670 [archaeon]|nr:MAG: hypothetical protein JSV92_03670 [archaeon]
MPMEERKFISNWGMALMFAALAWLFTFLEAGLTLNLIANTTFWVHNYMIFAGVLTFIFAFVYMRSLEDYSWLGEGVAFAIVFVLVNLFLDYGILFFILGSPIFNLQSLVLYLAQFLLCILASFVVRKKYGELLKFQGIKRF